MAALFVPESLGYAGVAGGEQGGESRGLRRREVRGRARLHPRRPRAARGTSIESRPSGPLSAETLAEAVGQLTAVDPDLAASVGRFGRPPMWARPPGFATLTFVILEQQVSLASARAAFERLTAATAELTPERFLRLDDAELLTIGFSRQKARYVRGLSRAIVAGDVDLEAIGRLDDADARAALTSLTGIGPWTADIYLLLALGRPDVWPATDLALVTAVQEVKRLGHRPSTDELIGLAEAWRPWRSVAARLFWHDYLSRRGQRDAGPELLDGA